MKKIYLVLTHTGTSFSNLIKKHTGNTYNHVSIALKEDLTEMYSFGRINPYIFFYGGFVVEGLRHGTFKRFHKTIAKVLELEVEDASYAIINNYIEHFLREKSSFGYNFLGVLKARKNINYQPSYRKFYCSQFVNYLLVCAHVIPEKYFGEVAHPEDFDKIEGAKPIFEGVLQDYTLQTDKELVVSE